MVKPFALELGCYPINKSVHNRSEGTVKDDWAGDFEHIATDSHDLALGFEFDGGGDDCVGETGNWDKASGTGESGEIVVDLKCGEKCNKGD